MTIAMGIDTWNAFQRKYGIHSHTQKCSEKVYNKLDFKYTKLVYRTTWLPEELTDDNRKGINMYSSPYFEMGLDNV